MTEEEHYMDKQHAIADEQQLEEWEATAKALTVIEHPASTLVRANIEDVTAAITEYRRVQAALDAAMPDCIQLIQRKPFRKKKYWRGVATAFNLTVEMRNETLDQTPEGAWGYLVVYRATAPNGRFADGDGACYASEKAEGQDTVHNVRGHAHTRAYNRAVSNLVGFGEVSAEEMSFAGRGASGSPQGEGITREPAGAGSAPRPATRREEATAKRAENPPVTEGGGVPLSPAMLALPWINEKLGFGKKAPEMTWAQMAAGTLESGRVNYLRWIANEMDPRGARMQAVQEHASALLGLIEEREVERIKAAQDHPDSQEWGDA